MTRRSAAPAKPWSRANAKRRNLSPDERWAESLSVRLLAACHPWQLEAVLDPARRISLLVGRGGGKTTTHRVRAVRKLARIQRGKVLYLATTRTQAIDLNWEPLKQLVDQLGEKDSFHFSESRLLCTCKRTGATYKMAGMDDLGEIEKYRGQPFDEVQPDEGASHDQKLLDQLVYRIVGPRLGERNGCIVLAGTPGHELNGLFYDVTRRGGTMHRPWRDRELPEHARTTKWSSHAWSLQDVADLPDAAKRHPAQVALWREALIEKEANGWTDDNPIWRREYLGEWAADDTENVFRYRAHNEAGEPLNQWDPERFGPLKFARLPEGVTDWLFGYGLDLGSKDPFACNVAAISPSDPTRMIRHVFSFERREMYAHEIAKLLIGEDAVRQVMRGDGLPDKLGGLYGITGWPAVIVADLAGLGDALIDELGKVYGIRIVGAQKGRDYKFGAIEGVNGHLVDGRMVILKGSPLETQMVSLQWKPDEFGQSREDKAQANHSSDSWIYLLPGLVALFEQNAKPEPKRSPYGDASLVQDADEIPGERGDDEYSWLLNDSAHADDGWNE